MQKGWHEKSGQACKYAHCKSFTKVVATCCLFLAGKAEETPKKCKDLIRTVRTLTNDTQFATFGVDPREEVMVIERVLLQVSVEVYLTYICFCPKLK